MDITRANKPTQRRRAKLTTAKKKTTNKSLLTIPYQQ
jgi:hypothetical protein